MSDARHHPVRQERSRKTLNALLDAAEQLLDGQSFTEISLAELVTAAGVTTGAFYSRFESKSDLLPSLYDRYLTWLGALVDEELDPDRWQGLTLQARTERGADLICRIYGTRRGMLRAMTVFARQQVRATTISGDGTGDASPPQLLLLHGLCDRLSESLEPDERPERDEIVFAVYSALTLARENILFPGLPMARALGLDPARLRSRLARLLEFTLSRKGQKPE